MSQGPDESKMDVLTGLQVHETKKRAEGAWAPSVLERELHAAPSEARGRLEI